MATQRSEPVQDAVKAYLELAMGLTEASKKRAEKTVKKVARELMGRSGATASQLQGLAEDLVNTGMANREAVNRLVRVEMDRALGRLGLATADEVATLSDRIEALERRLRDAAVAPAAKHVDGAAVKAADSVAAAQKTVAKKAVKKAIDADVPTAAKKAPAKHAPAKHAPAKHTPAKQAAAKQAPAKKAAKKAVKKAVKKAEPGEGRS